MFIVVVVVDVDDERVRLVDVVRALLEGIANSGGGGDGCDLLDFPYVYENIPLTHISYCQPLLALTLLLM